MHIPQALSLDQNHVTLCLTVLKEMLQEIVQQLRSKIEIIKQNQKTKP